MKIILLVLSILLLLFFILSLYIWYRFSSSVKIRVNSNTSLASKYPLPVKNVSFITKDNIRIAAWYLPVREPKEVIILIHGYTTKNGGKALMLPHADYLNKAGYSTLLLDLRSVGESEGEKIFLGVKEWQEVESAYDYLKALPENRNKKIGLFGISMGGNVAIITAGKTGKGDFIIASVPYASYRSQFIFELKKEKLPIPIALPLLELAAYAEFGSEYQEVTSEKLMSSIKKPIFIITAKNDGDVNKEDGKLLYELANEPKEYWQADTAHDVFDEKPEEFKRKILQFLESI